MQFTEMGNRDDKTLLLLPGTVCTWQLNFKNVLPELSERYHLIAVNYDGFEGDPNALFTDMTTVTEKIESYILEKHGGRVDGAYGSSLGGSVVVLLIQRKRIHIDHGFLGSSDLDQSGKLKARLLTAFVGPILSGACQSEKKRNALKAKLHKKAGPDDSAESIAFAEALIDSMRNLHPKTVARQFYSDYITPLANDIHADGTTVHVIYAKKMGEKYGERYRKHFRNPDIHAFDMKHEAWMYDDRWKKQVLETLMRCMDETKEE